MNKTELLNTLSEKGDTNPENLRIKMGNRIVHGQMADGSFRDELDDPKSEIISEAITKYPDIPEDFIEKEPQISGVIDIRNSSNDELLFRQDSSGFVEHNQVQPELTQELTTSELEDLAKTSKQVSEGKIEVAEAITSSLDESQSQDYSEEKEASKSFFSSLKKQIGKVPDSLGSTKKWLNKFAEDTQGLYQQGEAAVQKAVGTAQEVKQEVGELTEVAKPVVAKTTEKAKEVLQSDEVQALRGKVGDKVKKDIKTTGNWLRSRKEAVQSMFGQQKESQSVQYFVDEEEEPDVDVKVEATTGSDEEISEISKTKAQQILDDFELPSEADESLRRIADGKLESNRDRRINATLENPRDTETINYYSQLEAEEEDREFFEDEEIGEGEFDDELDELFDENEVDGSKEEKKAIIPETDQQSLVNRTAPVVAEWINTVDPESGQVEGENHSASWDSETSRLTLNERSSGQDDKSIMLAEWSDDNWVDRGSSLTEEKANYFEEEVAAKLQAHQEKQQQEEREASAMMR